MSVITKTRSALVLPVIDQEGMHYLEDISAGKLLVVEHGRREGVEGGAEVVVEKEDTGEMVKDSD